MIIVITGLLINV